MGLKAGFVGLPNVGKSTLFSAVTRLQAEIANYPFATIEPNVGIVALPDERLNELVRISASQSVVSATFEFIDIAGLVAGAAEGEGLGNKFLANIREVDAIVHVVRCFADSDITHVTGEPNPIQDVRIVELELAMSDLETLNRIIARTKGKSNSPEIIAEHALATKLISLLNAGTLVRHINLSEAETLVLKSWNLLTAKPVIFVANVGEKDLRLATDNALVNELKTIIKNETLVVLAAKIEHEISLLTDETEKQFFLADYGIKQSGIETLTRTAFTQLGLATYFTSGPKETRAWVFKRGMNAQQCAGIIHTDFARGFIRAEIVSYENFVKWAGSTGARQHGDLHSEGKEYLMKDGDVVLFRFNV